MLAVKEQLRKTVVRSGNGGAVWVPKDWLGEEVVVILPEKPRLGVQERIIHALEPHLKDIVAVGIYGSHARHEQTKSSDIDVLVITKDKLELKKQGLDIMSITAEQLKMAVIKHPALYYQIVQEAKPLINSSALDEFKSIPIRKEAFKAYLKETEEHLQSDRELLELDKLDGRYLQSYSVLYSALLRLRGLFIITCFLEKGNFTNKKFKEWVINNGLDAEEFDKVYDAYKLVRDSKPISVRIEITTAENVLRILEKTLHQLKERVW